MKTKKRQLRPSIRRALDYAALTAFTLCSAYMIILMFLFVIGIDL